MTFKRNLGGLADIKIGVSALSDELAYRMRKHGVKCTTVSVLIKDPDFKSISRQKALLVSTHLAKEISETALALIESLWNLKKPIRMLTITGANLMDEHYETTQLSLFDTQVKAKEKSKKGWKL